MMTTLAAPAATAFSTLVWKVQVPRRISATKPRSNSSKSVVLQPLAEASGGSSGKPDTHRTQSRRHLARTGVGQGPKSGGRRWLLPPVREAHKQDRRHSLLEEGELEFFKVNAMARLFQRLRHILCGTIVAEGASGSVATTLRGDVLCSTQRQARAPSGICECCTQLARKVFDDSIIVRPLAEASNEVACIGKRCTTKKPGHRHRRMLRPPQAATQPPRRRVQPAIPAVRW